MQRAPLTLGLVALAGLAAVVAPALRAPARGTAVRGTGSSPPRMPPTVSATASGPLRLQATMDQGAQLQGSGEDRYLVVEVTAPDLPDAQRRPVNLALVMDSSGSMAEEGKMDAARAAAESLVSRLGPQDTFALVTFDDRAWVRIPTTPARDPAALASAIAGLSPGGGTNLSDGLERGLAELDRPELTGVKRLIVLSDGMANLGEVDPTALTHLASAHTEEGVAVSTLGVGLDFNEDLLAAMADAGGGHYHFADRPDRLNALFADELSSASQVVGQELSLHIQLAPGVAVRWASGRTEVAGSEVSAFLGDLHSGETRKIVVKLSVPDSATGEIAVADVDLRYHPRGGDPHGSAHASVDEHITADAAEADASRDHEAGVQAARVIAADALDQGVRTWADGKTEAARQALQAAHTQLTNLAGRYDAPELQEQIGTLDAEAATLGTQTPDSDDGRSTLKKAKETARGYAW